MGLTPDEKSSYVVIIDSILAASDLTTITRKRIQQGLERAVGHDLKAQKAAIKELIMLRFENFIAEQKAISDSTAVNGHAAATTSEPKPKSESPSPQPIIKFDKKRPSPSDEDLSDLPHASPPIEKRKPDRVKSEVGTEEEDDAAYAARLQAELNQGSRSTRGAATRKTASTKKRKSPKKKTKDKVKTEDDSGVEDSSSEKEKNVKRNGAFHKPLMLSAPLSALLDGQTQLSRPQTVKGIWNYVKERDLQDPNDRRQIRCDDALRAVFKSEKVHMFTMNKILSKNLFEIDE
ncbi:hypothetical protein MMC25_003628 [Agyrium rufum]|nr:hypothetical protein [Agyrium rufum]